MIQLLGSYEGTQEEVIRFLTFHRCKKWSHRSRSNPRQQRYRLGLEMGPSAHCRVLWPYPTSDLDSWDRVHAKNGLTHLDGTQDSRDTDWVLKWVLEHIAAFCWVSRADINTVIVWLRPLDWYIICLVVNDGLISITITITKTITTTITITKTFFFFKKSLRASDVEAEPKFPSDLLQPVLRSGGGLPGISLI